MFGTLLSSVCAVMQLYVFWRISSIPLIKKNIPGKTIVLLGLGLLLLFLTARFYGESESGTWAVFLEYFSMTWLGFLFLTSLPLLFVDIVTLFGFLMSGRKFLLRTLAVCTGILLTTISIIQGTRAPVVHSYTIPLNDLPDQLAGKTVAVISDLHIGTLLDTTWLGHRIDEILIQKPDLILILGDFFEGHGYPQTNLVSILSRLSSPLGVWVVPGNHESHGNLDSGLEIFKKSGFHVLRNQWMEIYPGFILAGIDDNSHKRPKEPIKDLDKILVDRPQGLTVLLSHAPRDAEEAAAAGVKLMLSGHTHGGQIWPFSYLVGYINKYLEGQYMINKMHLIVTRGLGTWGPRMRLWYPAEFVLITLKKTIR